ncbi:MAG: hypothetical protein ABMB14_28045, partial [Myxococcota bacterium]
PDTRPEPAPAPGGTEGIRYEGDDTWQVARSKIDGWTADPGRLGATAVKKGAGYELQGVKTSSDAAALGAETGDLVTEVNGRSLANTADLLQLWAELGTADAFDVRLKRGGATRVHHYRVVK